ncbi:MAG TPA: M67 family metallopeptidase [Conexibacter sp.]|jgi:proteasome lid subunit RPN8/RPN11|nr:M67 family metallopeptidase [Conexibacter sp.]
MRIARTLYDQMVAHARAEAPNECCGVVGTNGDGSAQQVFLATNKHASPLRFEIEGLDLLRINNEIDDAGLEIGAIYHSHTRTAPEPSQTDINGAAQWPGALWIIVGLATDDDEPDVRTWAIEDGRVTQVELVVE